MIRRPPRSTLFPSRRSSDLPARATFVEGLDFPRPNRASDPVVGGDHENQPVDIEGGRMTIKLLTGRQPQAQWMPRRSRVREVIGQAHVERPCRVSHQKIESADA